MTDPRVAAGPERVQAEADADWHHEWGALTYRERLMEELDVDRADLAEDEWEAKRR